MISSTCGDANHAPLVVICPGCGSRIRVEVGARATVTDHDPDGIVEGTCGGCDAEFSVGFRRTGE
ncbi:MAG: hypothetical protein ABEJ28_09165 [Salinigranum sp.]